MVGDMIATFVRNSGNGNGNDNGSDSDNDNGNDSSRRSSFRQRHSIPGPRASLSRHSLPGGETRRPSILEPRASRASIQSNLSRTSVHSTSTRASFTRQSLSDTRGSASQRQSTPARASLHSTPTKAVVGLAQRNSTPEALTQRHSTPTRSSLRHQPTPTRASGPRLSILQRQSTPTRASVSRQSISDGQSISQRQSLTQRKSTSPRTSLTQRSSLSGAGARASLSQLQPPPDDQSQRQSVPETSPVQSQATRQASQASSQSTPEASESGLQTPPTLTPRRRFNTTPNSGGPRGAFAAHHNPRLSFQDHGPGRPQAQGLSRQLDAAWREEQPAARGAPGGSWGGPLARGGNPLTSFSRQKISPAPLFMEGAHPHTHNSLLTDSGEDSDVFDSLSLTHE